MAPRCHVKGYAVEIATLRLGVTSVMILEDPNLLEHHAGTNFWGRKGVSVRVSYSSSFRPDRVSVVVYRCNE